MARLFLASFLAGAAVVLVAVGLYPLPDPVRYASIISVVPNGGRQEDFVIHWPRDRIELPAQLHSAAGSMTSGAAILADPGAAPASGELFKLRDVEGNVIGVAGKTTTLVSDNDGAAESVSNWMLMIPSRGTLSLSQINRADLSPRLVPESGGRYIIPAEFGRFWAGSTRYRATAGPAADERGRVMQGTREFAPLSGSYAETWELDGVRPDGTTEGKIVLSTVLGIAP